MQNTLTKGQASVVRGLSAIGPCTDAALAAYVHHMDPMQQSSSSVRSRRCELERKGLVRRTGTMKMKSGRGAGIWEIV